MTPLRLRIKEIREAKKLSQERLAEMVGVRQATISDHERGQARRIDLDLIEALCKALDVDPGDLLVMTDVEGALPPTRPSQAD